MEHNAEGAPVCSEDPRRFQTGALAGKLFEQSQRLMGKTRAVTRQRHQLLALAVIGGCSTTLALLRLAYEHETAPT